MLGGRNAIGSMNFGSVEFGCGLFGELLVNLGELVDIFLAACIW